MLTIKFIRVSLGKGIMELIHRVLFGEMYWKIPNGIHRILRIKQKFHKEDLNH